MILSQVVQHVPQGFLQTVEEVERNAKVSANLYIEKFFNNSELCIALFRRCVDCLLVRNTNVDR